MPKDTKPFKGDPVMPKPPTKIWKIKTFSETKAYTLEELVALLLGNYISKEEAKEAMGDDFDALERKLRSGSVYKIPGYHDNLTYTSAEIGALVNAKIISVQQGADALGVPGPDHSPTSIDIPLIKWSTTGNVIDAEGVNHPDHYNMDPSGVECIQIVRHRNFNIGNAIKYLWRMGLKGNTDTLEDQLKDLKKAVWYIEDEITRLKAGNPEDS